MATHPGMLVAYDADGNIIAETQYQSVIDPETGENLGLVDFATLEEAGVAFRGSGEHVNVWEVPGAVGSAVWPQYLGAAARKFRVELDENKRIKALIHRPSGVRRTREVIERQINERVTKTLDGGTHHMGYPIVKAVAVDISDLVGGPDRALEVTPTGAVRRR